MLSHHSKGLLQKAISAIIPQRGISKHVDLSREVKNALNNNKPIVALESTIITHGMPYPKNLQTALEVEEIVRSNDAIPATIAILNGRIKIGQTKESLTELAQEKEAIKCSRRDIPFVCMGNGKTGGTTVSGTMLLAHMVGLKIFATGGIGGVHRNGQDSLDISADLTELGRTPLAVVCSGVKSILDIPRTLEFLETQGVCVATYGDAEGRFPDFYTRDSGCRVSYNLNGPKEAANLIQTLNDLEMNSGILIAVPIPKKFAVEKELINSAINEAYQKASTQGVAGKDVTPFLLEAIANITRGCSLEANMALIKNNALVAAKIAKELYRGYPTEEKVRAKLPKNKQVPIVIGASILDLSLTMRDEMPDILNGATYQAQAKQSAGGVGRNLAEGIFKLYGAANFISAVGKDELGKSLLRLMPSDLSKSIFVNEHEATSLCSVIFDKTGDCKLILGNMDIHKTITPDQIQQYEQQIKDAPLIVMDGNLSAPTMEFILKLADKYQRPVFFEPTDMLIAGKPFNLPSELTRNIRFISPNLYELKQIVEVITKKPITHKLSTHMNSDELLKRTKDLLASIQGHFDCIILTLGHHGVVVSLNSKLESQSLFNAKTGEFLKMEASMQGLQKPSAKYITKFYAAPRIDHIINVSGAGDSFSSGFITGLLRGQTIERSIIFGFMAAKCALKSPSAVPDNYDDITSNEDSMTQQELKILEI